MTNRPPQALGQSLPTGALAGYLARQMETFFPDGDEIRKDEVAHFTERALARVAHCFRHIGISYYRDGDGPRFDHLHTDQYATFLYFFSNSVHRDNGAPSLATKAYALNKALHGLDVYFAVDLPPVFLLVHPVGTVIGRATFSDFFAVYQNCTVGGDLDFNCPVFGRGVVMFGGSRVIGRSRVGSNCLIAAGATVIDGEIPDGTITFGQYPDTRNKPTQHDVISKVFGCPVSDAVP